MNLPNTMRAMVLERYGEPLVEREVPVPSLGPGDALVRVRACGVCGTDLKITAGKLKGIPLPHIPGHEPAGEVMALGPGAAGVEIGDHVAVAIYLYCGECRYCRSGRQQICPNIRGRLGFTIDGAYAEYVRVPASNLMRVDPSVPFDHIALLGDCITTAWHALKTRAAVHEGDWVFLTGAGGIGLHAIQLARLLGARVVAVDVDDEKLSLARRFGADMALNASRDDVVARVREATAGEGVDVALDFVSSQQALEADFALLRPDGALILVGYTPDATSAIRTMDIVLNEFRLFGSRAAGLHELRDGIGLLERRQIEAVVSRSYPLAQVNTALEELRNGRIVGRAVIHP